MMPAIGPRPMANTRVSISRPDTYERLPRTCEEIICEQQPVHTFGLTSKSARHREVRPKALFSGPKMPELVRKATPDI